MNLKIPPSSLNVKNMQSYTSTSLYLHDVVLNYMDNFYLPTYLPTYLDSWTKDKCSCSVSPDRIKPRSSWNIILVFHLLNH